MDWEDVEALNLPTQPEPPKYAGEPRAEISALSVLKVRMGIDNPTLDYLKAKMKKAGIVISPLEIDKQELWEDEIKSKITDRMDSHVRRVIDEYIDNYEFEGTAVDCEVSDPDLDLPEIEEMIHDAIERLAETVTFDNEQEYHDRAIQHVNKDLMKRLGVD